MSSGKGALRRREEQVWVINAKTKKQNNQENEQMEKGGNTPGPTPNYDLTSIIDYIRTLNLQEQDDFLD